MLNNISRLCSKWLNPTLLPAGPQLGSNEAIARAVAQGMGVALLPNVVTEDLVQLGKLIRLSEKKSDTLSRPLYQLHYKDRPSSPAAQAFEKSLFNA